MFTRLASQFSAFARSLPTRLYGLVQSKQTQAQVPDSNQSQYEAKNPSIRKHLIGSHSQGKLLHTLWATEQRTNLTEPQSQAITNFEESWRGYLMDNFRDLRGIDLVNEIARYFSVADWEDYGYVDVRDILSKTTFAELTSLYYACLAMDFLETQNIAFSDQGHIKIAGFFPEHKNSQDSADALETSARIFNCYVFSSVVTHLLQRVGVTPEVTIMLGHTALFFTLSSGQKIVLENNLSFMPPELYPQMPEQSDVSLLGVSCLTNLANAYNNAGYFKEAYGFYLAALSIVEKSSSTLFNLGVLFSQMGNPEKAAEYYQRSIDCQEHPLSFYRLAIILRKLGRLDDSIDSYHQALQRDQRRSLPETAVVELGRALMAQTQVNSPYRLSENLTQ